MRRRLGVVMAVTTVAVALVFLVPLLLVLRNVRYDAAVQDLVIAGTTFGTFIDAATPHDEIESAERRFEEEHPGIDLAVFDAAGSISGPDDAPDSGVRAALEGRQDVASGDGRLTVYVPTARPAPESPAFVIRVSADDDATAPTPRRILVVLTLSTAFALLVGGATGVLAARSIASPTARLTATARRLRGGDLTARATPEGPRELRELATTLNGLADRVDELLAHEREAGADLAHRLRTPVTALHLEVEALPDSAEARQLADRVERLERALTDVITDMRHVSNDTDATCDLVTVLRDRLADWTEVAGDSGRPFSSEVGPRRPRLVAIGSEDLEAVVDALVTNALHHTPPGTPIRVDVADSSDDAVEVVVDDSGPGFPDAMVARRGRSAGASTGLGLDITRRAIERAGGTLHLEQSPSGGARVRAVLPYSPDP